jgi:hypothetical protein
MASSVKIIRNARNARWLAWSFGVLYAVLMAAGLTLHVVTGSPISGVSFPLEFLEATVISVWSVVGALIVSRQPRHPVGWIWCLLPILAALDNIAWGYAYYGSITDPGSLPGVQIMIVWLYTLLGRAALGPLLFTLLFLLFPTGRPPSRPWNMLVWITVGTVAIKIPVTALAPNPSGYFPFPRDLFSLSGAAREVLEPLRTITLVLLPLCILAATFSLFVRLARARGVERQQLKWFVYSTLFVALGFPLTVLGPGNSYFLFGISLMFLGLAGVSVASAIAIFRYHLWEIDIIIRRTLIFGLLTGTLALVYFSSVVLLGQVFQALTGQNSPLAIVLSTLAIAALFSPLRRRIQDIIDRRFYRRKYDAGKTLANFAAVSRDQIDLNELSAVLLRTVQETVQPEHLSLWLKEQKANH